MGRGSARMERCRLGTRVLLLATVLTAAVQADDTWVPRPKTQLEYFHDNSRQVTWHAAHAQCAQRGADLVSVHSQNDTDFILDYVLGMFAGSYLWTGLSKLDGEFQWTDGSHYGNYRAWGDDQPQDDIMGKDCVFIARSARKWMTANCGEKKADVLCQRQTGVTPTPKTDSTTPKVPGFCPQGYIDAGSKCYKLFTTGKPVSWENALKICRKENGLRPDLASFHSSIDNAFATSQLKPASPSLWIGSRQEDNSLTWVWSDNSDTQYNNRQSHNGKGKCLSLAASRPLVPGVWVPHECAAPLGYICQTHKDPSDVILTPGPTLTPRCAAGFVQHGDGCYRFETEAATWREAEVACEAGHGHLVSIHQEVENAAIQVLTRGADVWIGLKKGASGEHEWSNGEYVIYTRWVKDPVQRDCVKMQATTGLWTGDNCGRKLPYVCKISTGPVLTTPAQIFGKCPPEGGWIAHGSFCYKIVLSPVRSWYTALDACPSLYYKAQLASIHHVVNNDWIYKQAMKLCEESSTCYSLNDLFIGLHKSRNDGALRWVDGSPVEFTHWVASSAYKKACAVMSKEHGSMWVDVACEETRAGYICKAPKAPVPTRPTEGPGTCPSAAWDSYGDSCFLYRPDDTARWTEAQAVCQENGGYMAAILAEHENDYIHEMMMSHTHLPKQRPFWIAAVRLNTSAVFGWLGGASMSYSHWGQGFPETPGANCVIMDPVSTVWKNQDCQQRAGVICHYDKVTASASGNNEGMSGGAVAGIVIGVLAIICFLFVATAYLVLVRRSQIPPLTFNNPLTPTTQDAPSTNNQC